MTDGGPICTCDFGYSGDGHSCADIDECSNGTAVCSSNANCVNRPGSYSCVCKAGFSGDGVTCTPSCGNGTCEPSQGESCSNCPADCGGCACTSCTNNASCPSGQDCVLRDCDGLLSCSDASNANACATIDGQSCPAVSFYGACVNATDCGSANTCIPDKRLANGQSICSHHCTTNADGPHTVTGPGLVIACINDASGTGTCMPDTGEPISVCQMCVIQCLAGGTCPPGLVCNGC
jgi:hypothetical protein